MFRSFVCCECFVCVVFVARWFVCCYAACGRYVLICLLVCVLVCVLIVDLCAVGCVCLLSVVVRFVCVFGLFVVVVLMFVMLRFVLLYVVSGRLVVCCRWCLVS